MSGKIRILSVILMAIPLAGCSLFRPHTQPVSISCSEPGVKAVINGNPYELPARLEVKRNKPLKIECYKKGFEPAYRTYQPSLNTTGFLDVLGGAVFLVPFIGLASPGAWSLNEQDIYIQLLPK